MNAPATFQGTALQMQMMNSFGMNAQLHNMNPEFRLTQTISSPGTASTSNAMSNGSPFIAGNVNPRNLNLHGIVGQITPPLKDPKSNTISQNHLSHNDKLQGVHSYGHTDASHLISKNVPNTPQYSAVLENDLQSHDGNWKNGVPFSTTLNVSWHLSMQKNFACFNPSARTMGSENRGSNAITSYRAFNEIPLNETTSKKIPDVEVRESGAIKESLHSAERQERNSIDMITKKECRPYAMPFKKRLRVIYQQTAEEQVTSLNDTTPQRTNFIDALQDNSLRDAPLNLTTFKTFQQSLAKTASYDATSQITTLPNKPPTGAFNESPLNLTTVKQSHQQHLSATHKEETAFSPKEEEWKSLSVRVAPNKEILGNATPCGKRSRDIDTYVATKEDATVGDPFKFHRTPLKVTAESSSNAVNENSQSLSNFIQLPKSKPVLIEEPANSTKRNALLTEADFANRQTFHDGPSCSKRQRDVDSHIITKRNALASDVLTSPRVPLKAVHKNCSNAINENHDCLSNCTEPPTREAVSIESDANITLCKQFDDMDIGRIETILQNLEAWHSSSMHIYQSLKSNENRFQNQVEEKNRLERRLLSKGVKISETDFEKFLLKKMKNVPDDWPPRELSVDSDKKTNPIKEVFSSHSKRLENSFPGNFASLPESFVADENGMVVIGPNGTKIAKEKLMSIKWNSNAPAITRKILMAIFDRNTLASANLSGKPSPAFIDIGKPLKYRLDPLKVADVTHFMTKYTTMTVREVRLAITTKCADENKMLRIQKKKND
ncbi:uncharacterized protein LOC119634178 [Glossina fuscipes]|uniref:Uncharacterized protein LOC119634178 n=1 Tax=Glossina fuscipes TaxID=7396 RepID=A0A8U0WEQ7_9MUSC|nr:uncharacterized protein LOC119634178 [Glossina fuscipes]KAI9586471.1 hypothetical protein GQX74_002318 [Glossina fuscipes]